MIKDIILAFVPLFVAVDAVGVLPIFLSLTQGIERKEKRKIIYQSIWTAITLAIGFILVGKALFRMLGITVGDFMLAGGMILFCIAIIDLLKTGKQRRYVPEGLGVVPIGTPLIVGPAVLTTCLIITDQYGVVPTIISLICNVMLAGLIFYFSEYLVARIGKSGANALSKIMALLLASIAVMMMRKAVFLIIAH